MYGGRRWRRAKIQRCLCRVEVLPCAAAVVVIVIDEWVETSRVVVHVSGSPVKHVFADWSQYNWQISSPDVGVFQAAVLVYFLLLKRYKKEVCTIQFA